MAFTVLYDACVLYPQSLRDLLIRLAQRDIFRARCTAQIIDEAIRAIVRRRPNLAEKLERTRQLMHVAVRDWLVAGYEPLVPAIELPDPDDRHVVAAAVRAHAQEIVTLNLSDFPRAVLEPHDLVARHPDEFLVHTLDLSPTTVMGVLEEMAASTKRPPLSIDDVLDALARAGVPEFAATLRDLRAES